MARHRHLDLAGVGVHVITAPRLRLDRTRLMEATRQLRLCLRLLDPLVWLHSIEEINAGGLPAPGALSRVAAAPRSVGCAHASHDGERRGWSRHGSGTARLQRLPHFLGDSNLYLRRTKDHLVFQSGTGPSRRRRRSTWSRSRRTRRRPLGDRRRTQDGCRRGLEEQQLALLAGGAVLSRARLRESLAVKNERLGAALESLARAGRLCHTPAG
jgi:hypothetical protein